MGLANAQLSQDRVDFSRSRDWSRTTETLGKKRDGSGGRIGGI